MLKEAISVTYILVNKSQKSSNFDREELTIERAAYGKSDAPKWRPSKIKAKEFIG